MLIMMLVLSSPLPLSAKVIIGSLRSLTSTFLIMKPTNQDLLCVFFYGILRRGSGFIKWLNFIRHPVPTCDDSENNDRNPDNSQRGHQRLRGRRAEQPSRGQSLILSLFIVQAFEGENVTQVSKLGRALVKMYLKIGNNIWLPTTLSAVTRFDWWSAILNQAFSWFVPNSCLVVRNSLVEAEQVFVGFRIRRAV